MSLRDSRFPDSKPRRLQLDDSKTRRLEDAYLKKPVDPAELALAAQDLTAAR